MFRAFKECVPNLPKAMIYQTLKEGNLMRGRYERSCYRLECCISRGNFYSPFFLTTTRWIIFFFSTKKSSYVLIPDTRKAEWVVLWRVEGVKEKLEHRSLVRPVAVLDKNETNTVISM